MQKRLEKSPTGIKGLDEITFGGLPKGRPTLICGNTGCGKTLLAMKFAIRGATGFGEHRVLMPFGETGEKLTTNAASPGFGLDDLASNKMILLGNI